MKTKGIWNFLKTIKGRSNISIPIIIIESTKNITSNTNIANIINSFFYTKVKNIINKFTTVDYDPLIFVRFLIPKPKAWLEIPYISSDKVENIIRKANNYSARGFDQTSMKFIKICSRAWAPHITCTINRSLMAGKFPEIMKVSRILPILKHGKDKFSKEFYRPISDLHCIKKIFEQHVKMHLDA